MCPEKIIRRFAGSFVLLSLLLGWLFQPAWLWLTAFVGANLLQFSFTDFCPLAKVLGHFRVLGCTNSRNELIHG